MVKFFQKYHKWIGLFFSFFLINFAISGICLNHRKTIATIDVPRNLLPKEYRYNNWNNAAIIGTIPLEKNKILAYGSSGVWLTDTTLSALTPFTEGLRKGTDNQNFRHAIITPEKIVFAITAYRAYKLSPPYKKWQEITKQLPLRFERLNDVYADSSMLYIMSRSHIYQSKANNNYENFEKIQLLEPENYNNKVSLFRTIWLLHSGALFGLIGRLIVDTLALMLIILTITGLIITFWRIPIKRRHKQKKDNKKLKKTWRKSMNMHNKIGTLSFILLLIVITSGWMLRPPLLIPIVTKQIKPIPFSTMDSNNPWHDKLRNIRYDKATEKWLLYSSDGFYQLKDFNSKAKKIKPHPSISVMGVNVWETLNDSTWIVGSFNGLYSWCPKTGDIFDAFGKRTHKKKQKRGFQDMSSAISGYSADFAFGDIAFDYNKGLVSIKHKKELPEMPEYIRKKGRMSLWHTAQELHVGRLYSKLLGKIAPFFIFLSGLLLALIIISGYIVYRKRHKKRKRKSYKK